MSDPQYGTQILRFVETALVDVNEEVDQFCVCKRVLGGSNSDSYLVKNRGLTLGHTAAFATFPDEKLEVYGVIQQSLKSVNNLNDLSEQNASDNLRFIPVATSGLLLVEQDTSLEPTVVTPLVAGDLLSITSEGKASKNNYGLDEDDRAKSQLVTINGTTPVVRSVVNYGKKHYALVYFP